MEHGKTRWLPRGRPALFGTALPRFSCRRPAAHLQLLSTRNVISAHRCAPATLRTIKERASAGTTRIAAFTPEFPQLIVFKKVSGTGNLKNHLVSKHSVFTQTLWPETPLPNQLRLSAAALGG